MFPSSRSSGDPFTPVFEPSDESGNPGLKETLPLITSRCGILFDEVPKKMTHYHKPTPVSSDFTFSNKAINKSNTREVTYTYTSNERRVYIHDLDVRMSAIAAKEAKSRPSDQWKPEQSQRCPGVSGAVWQRRKSAE